MVKHERHKQDCNSVVPDCHVGTKNGSESSTVMITDEVETTNEFVYVEAPKQVVVKHPEGLLSLHLHPKKSGTV